MNSNFTNLGKLRQLTHVQPAFKTSSDNRHYVVGVINGKNKAIFKSKGLLREQPSTDVAQFADFSLVKSEYEQNGQQRESYYVSREQQVIPTAPWS